MRLKQEIPEELGRYEKDTTLQLLLRLMTIRKVLRNKTQLTFRRLLQNQGKVVEEQTSRSCRRLQFISLRRSTEKSPLLEAGWVSQSVSKWLDKCEVCIRDFLATTFPRGWDCKKYSSWNRAAKAAARILNLSPANLALRVSCTFSLN